MKNYIFLLPFFFLFGCVIPFSPAHAEDSTNDFINDGNYDEGSNDFYWIVPDYQGSEWNVDIHTPLFDWAVYWSKYEYVKPDGNNNYPDLADYEKKI